MTTRFYDRIDEWVGQVLELPRNIATEVELREQCKVALNLFVEADVDESDSLSFDELKSLCNTAGLPMETDEEEALSKMDSDDSGTLDIEEWVMWWLKRVSTLPNPVKQQEAIARNTFNKFDVDCSGCLDSSELGRLTSVLGADFTQDELEEALVEMDADGSGLIELTEFLAWWTNRAAANRSNTSLISLKMRKLAAKAAQVFSTDIFCAAWRGDEELVKAFLQGEPRLALASDNSEYGEGWTALHYAAYQGSETVVGLLLGGRAEVNRANDMGFTPLFYAAQRGHIEICRILLEAGADPTITGVCALPGPLGSDGPPASGIGMGNDEAEAEAAALEVFMCPVDHCLDTPALRELFQSMSAKCGLPSAPDCEKVSASLALHSGSLALEVKQPQKTISHLPVKRWDLKLCLDMQMDTELVPADVYADIVASGLSLEISIPALPPKQAQVFRAVPLDKFFVHKVQFLCTLHKLKRLQLLEATPEALKGVWVEFCALYAAVDPQYRAALAPADVMYLIIKKCPDKKNTKDLRHGLRASIEQVTIRSTAAAAAASEKAGAQGKASKAPRAKENRAGELEEIDVTDPIALVNAAIGELFARRAAAHAAAAKATEQLEREGRGKESAAEGADAKAGFAGDGTVELLVIPNRIGADGKDAGTKNLSSAKAASRTETRAVAPRQGPPLQGATGSATKGWAWAEDTKSGLPTLSLQLGAVNSWGSGDFSSAVAVTILSGSGRR